MTPIEAGMVAAQTDGGTELNSHRYTASALHAAR